MPAPPDRPVRLRLTDRGPVLVDGPVEIVLPDGRAVLCERPVVAVCTCRRSRHYPLCDTSHRRRHPPPRNPDRPQDQQQDQPQDGERR